MSSFLYFAYGSNMLPQRLTARCPSAVSLGPAAACDWTLNFSKLSQDRSGKASLSRSTGREGTGVLFSIAENESASLDAAEGSEYRRDDRFQVAQDGQTFFARTYLGKIEIAGLKPYDWYLALIVAGAISQKLPEEIIEGLRKREFDFDAKATRPSRLEAELALRSAGSGFVNEVLDLGRAREP